MKAYPDYKSSGIDWLGDIPEHWKIAKIGWLFDAKAGGDAKPELYSDIKDDSHPYPVYTNTLIEHQVYAYSCEALFKAGSITVTGRGDIGHAFVREEDFDAIIRLVVLTPRNNQECMYFKYFIDVVIPFFTDSAAVGQLSASQIIKYHIAVPPISEQKAIAAYLDDMTGKVDALITEKQKQVEDLRSYRTSLITETVTRGLNPSTPLRPSDIDWLGDIPGHWISTKAKYYIEIKSGDPISKDDINSQGSVPIFGGGEIIGYTTESNVPAQTIIIGRVGARCGCVRLSDIEAWATDNALVVFTSQNPRFLTRIFEAANLNRLNESNAQPLITATKIKDLGIPLPPLAEQQAIAEFLDEKTEKIDALISELEKQLEELAEYKKAVISEAVTGKVDVRDWKPQN